MLRKVVLVAWALMAVSLVRANAAALTFQPEVLIVYSGVEGSQLSFRHASLKPVVIDEGKRMGVFAYRADGVESTCTLTLVPSDKAGVLVEVSIERRRPNETGISIYQHKSQVRLHAGETRIVDSDIRPKTKDSNGSVEMLQLTLSK